MTNISPETERERAWVDDHQHHHHRGEVINAATPSTSELPASIMTSGFTGHEHVEPEYDIEMAPPTERVGLGLIIPSRWPSWHCSSRCSDR
jgi:hypothetical protein